MPGINLIFFIFIFSVFTATAGSYGKLAKDTQVDREFKTGTIPATYSYNYYGWKGDPDAIIGIKEGYVINSKLWKPIDTETTSVRTFVQRMFKRDSSMFAGAWIKDSNGEVAGIWFSDKDGGQVKMAGENQIAYITPKTGSILRFSVGPD